MAKIAKSFCKKIYVTDDNPRKENPKKIRKQIFQILKEVTIIILQIEQKQLIKQF